MIVGGYNHAGAFAHATSLPGLASATPAAPATAAEETRQTSPTYFRSISSISYGSLANAYQSMRAFEAGPSQGGGQPRGQEAAPAILSGVGIPAALSAYGETMEPLDR